MRERVNLTARRGWPEPVRAACFWLWASTGRDAGRTARLYRAQLPAGALSPSPATIRRWRVQERWQEWASGDEPPLTLQSVEAWQTMWFRREVKRIETALARQATGLAVLSDPTVRTLLRLAFEEPVPVPTPLTPRERRARERLQRRGPQT